MSSDLEIVLETPGLDRVIRLVRCPRGTRCSGCGRSVTVGVQGLPKLHDQERKAKRLGVLTTWMLFCRCCVGAFAAALGSPKAVDIDDCGRRIRRSR